MPPLVENCYYCPCLTKCINAIFGEDTEVECSHIGHIRKWVEETIEKLNEITIPSVVDEETIREMVYYTGRSKSNVCDIFAPVAKCSSCLKRYGCTCSEEYNCKKNDYSMYEADMSSKWL